jgi:hypothetical protein
MTGPLGWPHDLEVVPVGIRQEREPSVRVIDGMEALHARPLPCLVSRNHLNVVGPAPGFGSILTTLNHFVASDAGVSGVRKRCDD